MSEPEPELIVVDECTPWQVEVVNKYSGLKGTPFAIESLDSTHASALVERVPPKDSEAGE
jgi:hypothetical protein